MLIYWHCGKLNNNAQSYILLPFLNQKITNFNNPMVKNAVFLQLLNIFGRAKYQPMNSLTDKITSFSVPFGDTEARETTLQQESKVARQQLEGQIEHLKTDAIRMGKQALVIGGTIMAVYLLLELILTADDDAENRSNSNKSVVIASKSTSSWLTKSVSAYAMTWLLGLAREKLTDFLATQNHNNEIVDTRPASEI